MYAHTQKIQQDKNVSMTNMVFKNADTEKSSVQLVDNRASTIVQRKLINTMYNYKGNAPIQLCAQNSSCPNSDPCPVHTYSQSNDPSLQSSIRFGEQYVGEKAMREQEAGKTPRASDVRVRASKTDSYQRGGAGLDEGLPTDQRDVVAAAPSGSVAAGIQSGLRGSTDLTILSTDKGVATGHTNMFPKTSGRGSTNTSGQANAHDLRRGSLPSSTDSMPEQVLKATASYVDSLATGSGVLASDTITGGVPNEKGATPIETPVPLGVAPGSQRLELAKAANDRREHVKTRAASLADVAKLPRPVSPPRTRIEDDGSGGVYAPLGAPPRPASPVPEFGGATPIEQAANASAWVSAPMRHGSYSVTKPKTCPKGHKNEATSTNCHVCKASI